MTEYLRDIQARPGYDHWECFYSMCDACWNDANTKEDNK